MVKYSCKNFL